MPRYNKNGEPVAPCDRRFQLVMRADEWMEIKVKADLSNLSVGAYLRACALNKRLKSNVDQEAVKALIKLSADQGRLGGLLKLWLSERPDEGAPEIEVVRLLGDIEELRGEIRSVVARL